MCAGERGTVGGGGQCSQLWLAYIASSLLCNGTPRLQTSFPTFSVGELKEQPSQRRSGVSSRKSSLPALCQEKSSFAYNLW